mmetsp:Transcript_27453/g.64776  ORF Transcript_27453/g.64776 Transcript_27453/m.64776 type:complete len:249 (-) Transcript_27453:241-987(-)
MQRLDLLPRSCQFRGRSFGRHARRRSVVVAGPRRIKGALNRLGIDCLKGGRDGVKFLRQVVDLLPSQHQLLVTCSDLGARILERDFEVSVVALQVQHVQSGLLALDLHGLLEVPQLNDRRLQLVLLLHKTLHLLRVCAAAAAFCLPRLVFRRDPAVEFVEALDHLLFLSLQLLHLRLQRLLPPLRRRAVRDAFQLVAEDPELDRRRVVLCCRLGQSRRRSLQLFLQEPLAPLELLHPRRNALRFLPRL